jgi:glycosyltransferase involved in cell wall biosynthesis
MKVLFDGWALAYAPNSPGAIHLQTLLEQVPGEVQALVGLPAAPASPLPRPAEPLITPNPPGARLAWEQRRLPALLRRSGAVCTHLAGGSPALFARRQAWFSPAGFDLPASLDLSPPQEQAPLGFQERLREALFEGSLGRVQGILWPDDLPSPPTGLPLQRLPVILPSAFYQPAAAPLPPGLDLPENYLLYHGPSSPADLQRLLSAWSWAAGLLGEQTPLVLLGLEPPARRSLPGLLERLKLAPTVRLLPDLPFAALPALYRQSSALFHPARLSPWGDPYCLALACGVPVIGIEDRWSDARLGPAAYLVKPGGLETTSRALGAALVTVVGEPGVGEALSEAGKKRSAACKAAEQLAHEGFARTLAV